MSQAVFVALFPWPLVGEIYSLQKMRMSKTTKDECHIIDNGDAATTNLVQM